MRKCPSCDDVIMDKDTLYLQEIERCGECNGIFLDDGELGAIVRLMKLYRSVKLEEPEIETLDDVNRLPYNCPADGSKLTREDYGGLPVDTCDECRGIWLDDGELVSLKRTENHIRANLGFYVRLAD